LYFYYTNARLRQNLLFVYSFVNSLPDDGFVEAETGRTSIINANDYY